MGRRPAPRVLTLTFLFVAAILAFALVVSPTAATFTSSTANPGTSLSSTSDFGTGSLSTWGGTWVQSSALRIGARSDWQSVAVGYDTECAIRADHSLWCSGYNGDGQLGQGDTRSRPDLTQVGTATTWTSVGVGRSPVCGLQSDGTLWCWGWDTFSQLGDGRTANRYAPVQVTSPAATGWTQVSSGYQHTCALRSQDLYCWGSAQYGQLGTGSSGSGVTQLAPAPVAGSWATLSSGQLHTCGLRSDATLWCWGRNASGQLGLGNTTDATTPTQVGNLTWDSLSSGAAGTCATHPGELWCWGDNTYGSVGDGTVTNRSSPLQITSPATSGWTPVALASSGYRACDIRTDGALWCWGFGYGTTNLPSSGGSVTDWRRPVNGTDFSCALKALTQLYCWGLNGAGQLGIGSTTTATAPTRVLSSPATDWDQVSAGAQHTCAVGTDTTLWCWGSNASGRLGIGAATGTRTTPTQVTVPSSTGWSQVSASSTSTCAVRADTTLYCWGLNTNGQLGNGTTTMATSPAQVTVPASTGWSGVSLGSGFACAQQPAGQLSCWGSNSNGQLGTGGGTANQTTPAPVSGTWTSVSAGGTHTCAIDSSSQLFCWGYGQNGRLGIGTVADSTTPAQVGTATDWRSVSGGSTFTCGSRARPAVYCWGADRYGQIGIGDNYDYATPQLVRDLTGRPITAGSQSVTVISIR